MAATASSASKQAPSTVVQHGGVQPLVSTGAARPRSGIATSSAWKGFWFSGLACCVAEAVTIPVDVVKTRLQLQGELGAQRQYLGVVDAVGKMARTEGPIAFFKGLTPALLRQSTYGTLRYGLYEPIKGVLSAGHQHGDGSAFWHKILAGTLSGAVSSSLCNPTDVVKVRMQAENLSSAAVPSRPRYRNTAHAFVDIFRTEGLRGLYRGVGPTAARASVGAATELATYDDLKGRLVRMGIVKDGFPAHLAGSLAAGFVSTLANSPFDVVKSRVMNQPVGPDGHGLVYRGMLDCFAKGIRSEGVFAFWKGFWPNYARVGPRVTIIFLVIERLREWFD